VVRGIQLQLSNSFFSEKNRLARGTEEGMADQKPRLTIIGRRCLILRNSTENAIESPPDQGVSEKKALSRLPIKGAVDVLGGERNLEKQVAQGSNGLISFQRSYCLWPSGRGGDRGGERWRRVNATYVFFR